jgi:alpha-ribazole phosphatase
MQSRFEENFRECDFGDFEGKVTPSRKQPGYRRWIALGGTQAPPNGESKEAFKRRGCEAFGRPLATGIYGPPPGICLCPAWGTIMAVLERFAVPAKPFYTTAG